MGNQVGYVGRIPAGGEPEIVITDITYLNGLAFSPDYQSLYFTSTNTSSLYRTVFNDQGEPGPAELANHQLAVQNVHLAAHGLDVDFPGGHLLTSYSGPSGSF